MLEWKNLKILQILDTYSKNDFLVYKFYLYFVFNFECMKFICISFSIKTYWNDISARSIRYYIRHWKFLGLWLDNCVSCD